jgi:hypothetical protein
VYCIGAGTVLVDAVKSFSIAVERISRLGSCPGTPIAGELTLCTAPFGACPREIWGSLDGIPVLVDGFSLYTADAFTDEYLIGDSTLAIRFKHVDREPTFAGGLVWTTPDSPFGGAVYCASEGTFMEEPESKTAATFRIGRQAAWCAANFLDFGTKRR